MVEHYGGNRSIALNICQAKRAQGLVMANPDLPEMREADLYYAPWMQIDMWMIHDQAPDSMIM